MVQLRVGLNTADTKKKKLHTKILNICKLPANKDFGMRKSFKKEEEEEIFLELKGIHQDLLNKNSTMYNRNIGTLYTDLFGVYS